MITAANIKTKYDEAHSSKSIHMASGVGGVVVPDPAYNKSHLVYDGISNTA